MSSLLEAAAALGISAAVTALLTASLSGAVRVHTACVALTDDLFEVRQLEHLVDRSALAAGAGPMRPAAISSLSSDTVVFASDSNGNGSVDATSSETTALEVRQIGAQARVRVRLGRQTMTVLEADESDASLVAVDKRGLPASSTTASLVELAISPHAQPEEDTRIRRMLFSLPAQSLP
jgi:type II secretory pathway component PulJ